MSSSADIPTLKSPENLEPIVRAALENDSNSSTVKLRVVQVVEATSAGVGQHVLDLVDGLLDEPFEIHLIYSPLRMNAAFESKIQEFAQRGAKLFECSISPKVRPSDYTSVKKVRAYLKQHGPFDLIHGHSSKGGAIARLAARGLKTPVIYTPHAISTWNPQISSVGYFLYGSIERLLSRLTTCLVAISPDEATHCIKLGLPETSIQVVPNCIREFELPSREEVRQKYDLPLDKTVLGFVGRFSPQKGPEIMIKAFAKLANKFPDTILAMIGSGELEEEIKELTNELKLSEQVKFLGAQPGDWSMPGFDIFCMTSRYEAGGFPYVAQEAARAALPIVTTRYQCESLLVDEGENGYIVEDDNVEMMAEAIEKLLSNPDRTKEFGKSAFEKYKAFSAEGMISKYSKLYRSLCE